ncbi:MAG: hypothetical protein WAK82_22580 [Streptosporangiaceae bacterium]
MAMVHQERSGEAEEGLNGEERDLPPRGDWGAVLELAELLPRLAD